MIEFCTKCGLVSITVLRVNGESLCSRCTNKMKVVDLKMDICQSCKKEIPIFETYVFNNLNLCNKCFKGIKEHVEIKEKSNSINLDDPNLIRGKIYKAADLMTINGMIPCGFCHNYVLKEDKEEHAKNCTYKKKKEDLINEPNHYHKGGVDVIAFCNGKVNDEQMKGFYRVNVIKYVGRYELKNGLQDLEKAKWNLEKLIELEGK
ncbi:DUF3310 domain-containing protein [Bacillus toyonensis]|uniref:DUF3310 domain-containing protein n=1 Tax=Bacillus toyonensis TaxID=155322 RepID=UPI00270C138F|nr:DUF3310 domain-containing protein [Bacillus toyonensis]MDO8159164.1 DUF3310 domain-containing protein [Bacillus toyonensis]